MIILGIDPGTRFAGYSILEHTNNKTILRDYGCLKMRSRDSIPERLHILSTFFEDKITTHCVTHMAIETAFYSLNANTFAKLSYVRGVLYLLATEYCLELLEYSPMEIKQAITGYGGAPKTQVATVLYTLFPTLKTVDRDDITDAIAIGVTGIWRSPKKLEAKTWRR